MPKWEPFADILRGITVRQWCGRLLTKLAIEVDGNMKPLCSMPGERCATVDMAGIAPPLSGGVSARPDCQTCGVREAYRVTRSI